jgi:hypothetical protein
MFPCFLSVLNEAYHRGIAMGHLGSAFKEGTPAHSDPTSIALDSFFRSLRMQSNAKATRDQWDFCRKGPY